MAEADLDVVIRQIAKAQTRSLIGAAKKRRDQYLGRAAKTTNKEAKAKFKLIAKNTMLHGTATAKRLQNSAENAADSYARAIKKAMEEVPAQKPAKKTGKKNGNAKEA
jgi:hypothetical protein